MRDVTAELKALRLHGMVSAWEEIMGQGLTSIESSRWRVRCGCARRSDCECDVATRVVDLQLRDRMLFAGARVARCFSWWGNPWRFR